MSIDAIGSVSNILLILLNLNHTFVNSRTNPIWLKIDVIDLVGSIVNSSFFIQDLKVF